MGIADRRYNDYDPSHRMVHGLRLVSFNTWLIIINSLIFVVQQFGASSIGKWIGEYGNFSTYYAIDPHHLEFWRVVTFQFLHADIMHLVFNMLGLYMFGELVERALGFKIYAAFYLICGIFGALMYMTLNLLGSLAGLMGVYHIPGLLYPNDSSTFFSTTKLIGASAGVFGVIVAAAYIAPNSIVNLLIPPIPLKLRTFAYGYVALAVASLLIGTQNAGGQAAHVGGALAGYFFIRRSHMLTDFFDIFTDSRRKAQAAVRKPGAVSGGGGAGRFRTIAGAAGAPGGKTDAKPSLFTRLTTKAPPTQQEIDRILDKLRAGGLASLTEGEKDALRRATEAQRDQ